MIITENDKTDIDVLRVNSQKLKPRQIKNLNELICIGGSRPEFSPVFIEELHEYIENNLNIIQKKWGNKQLSFTKTNYLNYFKCEGLNISSALGNTNEVNKFSFIGSVAHLSIQLHYSHKRLNVDELVAESIIAIRKRDSKIDEWFSKLDKAEQSNIISSAVSKVTNFVDDWPPLNANWSPRFEEPISIRISNISISSRADLIIGRPRNDSKQTMMLVDLKSSPIKDEHYEEASFYALMATLRYNVMPWRSLIYSLSSGEYSEPDVTESRVLQTATNLIKSIESYVEVMKEIREPILSVNENCKYCILSVNCKEIKKQEH